MLTRRRAVVLPGVLFLAAFAAGCGAAPGGAAGPAATPPATPADKPAAPVQVVIDNFTFDPPELTVAAGTEVKWVNRDDVPHTATSTAKPRAFDSGTLDTDGTFAHVFDRPGVYEYYCAVHPKMTGRVVVK
jgi:plastocyanin